MVAERPRWMTTPPKFHAIHEAAHAVALWLLTREAGEPEPGFDRIYLVPRQEAIARASGLVGGVSGAADGYVPLHEYVPNMVGPSDAQKAHLRQEMERAVVILLAGPAAEARHVRRGFHEVTSRDVGGHRDLERAQERVNDFAQPGERDELMRRLLSKTRALLRCGAVWPTIKELANALLERRDLTGEQALEIIRQAWVEYGGVASLTK